MIRRRRRITGDAEQVLFAVGAYVGVSLASGLTIELIQRRGDRRAELTGLSEAAELELLTAPVEPLIAELERRVPELTRCDAELDEATMVRALAVVDATISDPDKRRRERLLDGRQGLTTCKGLRHMDRQCVDSCVHVKSNFTWS